MRILYGIQGTGNGHISRANALLPELKTYAEIDVLISGKNYTASLNHPTAFHKRGLSYTFGKNGGIDYLDTARNINPLRFLNDIRSIPVTDYDLILNDFEPLTAWAAAYRNVPGISVSHQAAFLSDKTPRPESIEKLPELIFRNYAPCDRIIGFHYSAYDRNIYTPMMREEIRNADIRKENHVTVYLPAYDEKLIMRYVKPLREVDWHIFCRGIDTTYKDEHITLFPISNQQFVESATSSCGMMLASGFESTSEALFLGKKLLTVPMRGQYEQKCNAAALRHFGATIVQDLSESFTENVFHWLGQPDADRVPFSEKVDDIIDVIFSHSSELV